MFDRDLNELECSFIGNVVKDISEYMNLITMSRDIPIILLIPPVNNHLRFLIHTLIQKTYVKEDLFSTSLGKYEARRVAIFPNALKKCEANVMEVKTEIEGNTEKPEKQNGSAVRNRNVNCSRECKNRKPDLQVYVPRAKRLNEENIRQLKRKSDENVNLIEQLYKKKEEHNKIINRERMEELPGACIKNVTFDEKQKEVDLLSDSGICEEFLLNDGITDQRCDEGEDGINVKRNDISYDLEFIDPSMIDELNSTVGKAAITHAKEDYRPYQSMLERNSEGHFIVEIYNFPVEYKTRDLLSIFQTFKDFKLSWVDDTHALGIFSSPVIADFVLRTEFPVIKTRPLREATAASRLKAKQFIVLPAVRPKTCTAAARRLVSSALGVKIAVKPSVRAAEKKMLLEAKEEKKRMKQLKKEGSNSCNENGKSI